MPDMKKDFLLKKNQQKMRRGKVSSPFLVYILTKAIVTPKKIAWYLVRYQKWSFMLSFLKAHFNYGKSRTWFWQSCQVEMLVHETYKVRLQVVEKNWTRRKKKKSFSSGFTVVPRITWISITWFPITWCFLLFSKITLFSRYLRDYRGFITDFYNVNFD